MRIISGTHKSRVIKEPKGRAAHPMGDRVREALFNILHDVGGRTLLDAYAGSGAVAIEAISRGAAAVWAVEKSAQVYKTLSENIELLHLQDQIKASRANISTWIDNHPDLNFDIIVCDPPYDSLNPAHIYKLASHLSDEGVLVLSHLSAFESPFIDSLELQSSHQYGNATLAFYKKA